MKNFIFDLYNTLIDIRTDESREETWAPVVGFFAERGVRAEWQKLRDRHDSLWAEQIKRREAEGKYSYPEGDMLEVFRSLACDLGCALSTEEAAKAAKLMRRASVVWIRLFAGVQELFAKLRAAGAKLFLLSNAQAAITYDEIEQCGLSDKFDGLLISSEYGCRKPDPKYFEILFDKFGLEKSESVMIGDDPFSDGEGAKNFGIAYAAVGRGGAPAIADELLGLARS